jgi:choline-sulfatase
MSARANDAGFVRTLGTALLTFVLGFVAHADDSPNVLLIVADDHAPYVMGAYGNDLVHTPNLDRLAASGMRFDRAYCNAPVCTASRASFLTGRYPRTIGVTQLRTALPAEETTLAEVLGANGYDTAAFGKMHFNSNLSHGFRVRADRPQHAAMLKARGAQPLSDDGSTLGPWRPFKSPAREWLNSMTWPYPAVEGDMPSHFFVDEAEKFLTADRDGPFFCIVSFYEPHSPFHFPVEYCGRHTAEEFDPPEPGIEDAWQVPKIFQDLTREEKQGITAAYYTSTEYMDANVGRLLAILDATGKADDTLVIYFGDHGYFLGHHGRFEKHSMFEEAVRVPLVIRYPDLVSSGSSSDALVELVDVFPTVTDLCNIVISGDVQGHSLRPILDGSHDRIRDYVFVEYSENEEGMVRDKQWKLIYGTGNRARQDGYEIDNPTPGRYILLYDTVKDPHETTNLANDPAQADRVTRMVHLLREHFELTARRPELLPQVANDFTMLDACLQPRDVQKPE